MEASLAAKAASADANAAEVSGAVDDVDPRLGVGILDDGVDDAPLLGDGRGIPEGLGDEEDESRRPALRPGLVFTPAAGAAAARDPSASFGTAVGSGFVGSGGGFDGAADDRGCLSTGPTTSTGGFDGTTGEVVVASTSCEVSAFTGVALLTWDCSISLTGSGGGGGGGGGLEGFRAEFEGGRDGGDVERRGRALSGPGGMMDDGNDRVGSEVSNDACPDLGAGEYSQAPGDLDRELSSAGNKSSSSDKLSRSIMSRSGENMAAESRDDLEERAESGTINGFGGAIDVGGVW